MYATICQHEFGERKMIMAFKNKAQVVIEGKTITIAGTESQEYLEQIASYIEEKRQEIRVSDAGKALNATMLSILTSVNVADDYFKELEHSIKLQRENDDLKIKMSINADDNRVFEQLNSKIKKLEDEVSQKEALNSALGKQLEELRITIGELSQQVQMLNQQNTALNQENAALKSTSSNINNTNQNGHSSGYRANQKGKKR